jgi:hypothetical protein
MPAAGAVPPPGGTEPARAHPNATLPNASLPPALGEERRISLAEALRLGAARNHELLAGRTTRGSRTVRSMPRTAPSTPC